MPYEGTGTKQAIGSNNRELVRAEPLFCQVKGPKYCYSIAIGDRQTPMSIPCRPMPCKTGDGDKQHTRVSGKL